MNEDVALTATGTPALVLGNERYPLVFTIAGMKEFAEHRGVTFETLLRDGWDVASLTEADIRLLLKIALVGGERRRALFDGGEPRPITKELVDRIMGLCHPTELVALLIRVWNEPPVSRPDPQMPESPPPGA